MEDEVNKLETKEEVTYNDETVDENVEVFEGKIFLYFYILTAHICANLK